MLINTGNISRKVLSKVLRSFDKNFERLHLDKSTTDSTVISYQLKLKKFIESVLLRDGLIEKIKASFSGYIFLSYRKKDRKFVQDVMKAIHYNEFCRDIAIWYDEYLIPGEDFNETILKTLVKKSVVCISCYSTNFGESKLHHVNRISYGL